MLVILILVCGWVYVAVVCSDCGMCGVVIVIGVGSLVRDGACCLLIQCLPISCSERVLSHPLRQCGYRASPVLKEIVRVVLGFEVHIVVVHIAQCIDTALTYVTVKDCFKCISCCGVVSVSRCCKSCFPFVVLRHCNF